MVVEIKKVGVIGAGQMGNGIAHVCAVAGFDVWLNDISVDRVQSGLASINGNMARQVAKGLITEDERTAALDRLKPAESMDELADVDLVIESAVENEQIKRKIFAQLCPLLKPEAILATNTSSISITRLAATTDRPERFDFESVLALEAEGLDAVELVDGGLVGTRPGVPIRISLIAMVERRFDVVPPVSEV